MNSPLLRFLLLPLLALAPGLAASAGAQQRAGDVRVSIVYTGRSLGALGVLRAQDEHELLTEQALAEGLEFKLVSHAAWRAPGVTVFLPSEEPEGDELPAILAARDTAEPITGLPALRSANVLIVQDPNPDRQEMDLLAVLERNPRRATDFPDLDSTTVTVYRLRSIRGNRAIIVQEEGAVFPTDTTAWTRGEINRVDLGDSRIFELPYNLVEMGSRATVLHRVRQEAEQASAATLLVDLGERDGDLGVDREARARIDYTVLRRLGYTISVPFEFELALGADGLARLRDSLPGHRFLAANLSAKDTTLLQRTWLVEVEGVTIGLFGLVAPDVRGVLPRLRLDDFTFASPLEASRRAVRELRAAGADAIVALSNLDPGDNALIAREVAGIDAIVADLHVRWSPETIRTEVDLPDRPASRPGSPALVARGFANGLGVGRLDLAFHRGPEGGPPHLAGLAHTLESVTDRTPADLEVVREIRSLAQVERRPRGELMFPAFIELTERHPELRSFDDTTAQGRVSKRMWEETLARMLRIAGRAEVAIMRKLPHFPPLIGKLHEDEIRSWLWTEDQVVLVDLLGSDLAAIVAEDRDRELVLSGIGREDLKVMGRNLDPQVYYRVATTDVLFESPRFSEFENGRRVARRFRPDDVDMLQPDRHGEPLGLRELAIKQLQRTRAMGKGEEYLDRIARLVAPDRAYQNLFTFNFDRPTLWASLSNVYNNEGYQSVPESRVTSADSWVVGVNGRFTASYDRQRFATDVGLEIAYARQSADLADGSKQVTESADDLKLDLTWRPKSRGGRISPFVRGLFDTEFTPTVNPVSGLENSRQLALRGIGGVLRTPTRTWRTLELGVAVERDFGLEQFQYGLQGRSDARWPLGAPGGVTYVWRNDLTWFLPTSRDTESDLALRYNMVHQLLIPLVDELSLSVTADLFFFQGKVETTDRFGTSMLLRVGLTYDRLWKPRYQPFF